MNKEKYKDTHNKEKLTIKNNNFYTNDDKEAGINLVLENGNEIIDLAKKAQQQIAELEKTLDRIKNFIPSFRLK